MLLGIVLLTATSFAMSPEDEFVESTIIYQKSTTIDFEEMEIEGQLVKPQGALLLERKKASFNPLIQIRENFNEELKRSVNTIK